MCVLIVDVVFQCVCREDSYAFVGNIIKMVTLIGTPLFLWKIYEVALTTCHFTDSLMSVNGIVANMLLMLSFSLQAVGLWQRESQNSY